MLGQAQAHSTNVAEGISMHGIGTLATQLVSCAALPAKLQMRAALAGYQIDPPMLLNQSCLQQQGVFKPSFEHTLRAEPKFRHLCSAGARHVAQRRCILPVNSTAAVETLSSVTETQVQESIEVLRKTRLITAVKTPYREDGKFDLRAYDAHLHRQIEHGVEGVIVGGTTGEV